MRRLIIFLFLFISIYTNATSIASFIPTSNLILKTSNLKKEKISNEINVIQSNTIEENSSTEKNEAAYFNKLINLLSIALVTILSLLSLALYKNNKIETKSNNLLKEKNKELELERDRTQQAIQDKNDFLATISHELKTPLNAINIISEILMNEDPKENQVENLISLKISTNHLMNLINDVLQINRIESPNFTKEEIEFNLRKKVDEIDKSLQEIAKLNNVHCKINIDEAIPKKVIGDATKITQILINLISNAIKFTKNGTVITNVELINETEQEVTIKFEVIDNGIGIPKDKQEIIFENFTQASSEINKKFGGSGLGLTIVKKLLEHLGSSINLQSEENVGSNFNFELVLKTDKKYLKEIQKTNYSILKEKNILLVEDNSMTQILTKKLITKYHAICTIASNGKEALKLSKQNNYDIILMDINLPDINGDKVTQEIRKFNSYTPIIAFTAITIENEDCVLNIISKGFNDYITKPVDTTLFYKKIINLLKINN